MLVCYCIILAKIDDKESFIEQYNIIVGHVYYLMYRRNIISTPTHSSIDETFIKEDSREVIVLRFEKVLPTSFSKRYVYEKEMYNRVAVETNVVDITSKTTLQNII